jgi:hypothetical protein
MTGDVGCPKCGCTEWIQKHVVGVGVGDSFKVCLYCRHQWDQRTDSAQYTTHSFSWEPRRAGTYRYAKYHAPQGARVVHRGDWGEDVCRNCGSARNNRVETQSGAVMRRCLRCGNTWQLLTSEPVVVPLPYPVLAAYGLTREAFEKYQLGLRADYDARKRQTRVTCRWVTSD